MDVLFVAPTASETFKTAFSCSSQPFLSDMLQAAWSEAQYHLIIVSTLFKGAYVI